MRFPTNLNRSINRVKASVNVLVLILCPTGTEHHLLCSFGFDRVISCLTDTYVWINVMALGVSGTRRGNLRPAASIIPTHLDCSGQSDTSLIASERLSFHSVAHRINISAFQHTFSQSIKGYASSKAQD